nr:MAG TPA: hypothetical protein [Caudoviricetes sp.]
MLELYHMFFYLSISFFVFLNHILTSFNYAWIISQ